ncbi:outer membrane protein assembly factor BamB [Aquipseudomonas ullengensis]|uniref:Outer membrane protein assembly factor BamB n=1 Tax=Aquipseudomonas ullengensis TaxID=2759166 RepID=A0A7W4LM94_9GAMM|nr:outer membrane protein assembly factor BamB [Pseudomonas ullengensis]MBB2495607.1 outer membrane protein assembly factor BamB [Pseudomonas ullengensis]
MRDVMRWKNAAVLALAVLAVGCSSNSKKELPPAELPDIQEEVQLEKQWSRSIGDGQGELYNQLAPAVDGERLYAASADGEVVAMDRLTGDKTWEVDLELPVSGGVGAGYGLVLVGTLKGEVIALDATSGEERWRARVTSEVLSAPATNGDVVVVQTQDDRLIALDASTGSQRWIFENSPAVLTLRGTSSPVLTNRLAIAGLSSGKVIALDTQRGIPVWEQRVAVPKGRSELERVVDIDGNLLLSGGTLYVVTYQGQVAALDVDSGRPQWTRDASSYVGLAQGFGNVYVTQAGGSVESIDERSNSSLWNNEALARRQLSAPEVFSSYVAVGDFEGYLHLLSQVDGHFVGREKIDGDGVRVRPLVVGDWIYAYGNSGKLVALTIR